jgi:spore germination protein YaaH
MSSVSHPATIHEVEMRAHQGLEPPERVYSPPPGGVKKEKVVNRIVYGYFPHWMADIDALQWEALTHVAYFGVSIDGTGNVVNRHGWPAEALIQAAHANETKIHVTIALFDTPAIAQLCSSASYRATAIDNIIAEMEAGGADGVSIDFESPDEATRDDFTLFISELRAELDSRGYPEAEISVAGTAWSLISGIDLAALLDYIDIYFIMAYPYFGSWSTRTGPVGKLRTTFDWATVSRLSTARTVARYTSMIDESRRRKIVLGVPYYGYQWTCADDQPASSVVTGVGSVFYSEARQDLESGRTRLWDEGVRSPWYAWQDGGWNQVWYDDEESLAYKYRLALEQDLGGVGMWALNYDVGYQELWDLLESSFSQDPTPLPGDRFDPIRIDSFPYHDQRDTSDAPSNYFNYYSCRPDLAEYGREWVYRIDVCQPGTIQAHVPEDPDIDPDLHLLDAPFEAACIDRAHLDLEVAVAPGMYLLTVDTWVNDDDVALEGPYDLTVDFTPEPGSEGCASHLTCESGVCVCSDGLSDCGTECVDLSSDPQNCGECENACSPDAECVEGQCVGSADGGTIDSGDASLLPCCPCPDGGCGCRGVGANTSLSGGCPPGLLVVGFFLLIAGLGLARRRGLESSRRERRHDSS